MTSKKTPSVSCYRSKRDLHLLKDWFYNFSGERDKRFRAVQRVRALGSRGRLPHAIESTSLFTSVILTDTNDGDRKVDCNTLQLSYAMAIIRFVNGLLDPFQQAQFAVPLHQLARKLNLPGVFVELRHMGTHEAMPNLEVLREASKRALNWLFDNYWATIETNEDEDESELEDAEYSQEELKKMENTIGEVVMQLKTFKKVRKQDLNKIIKFGNTSAMGIKYWEAVNKIKELSDLSCLVLYNVLMFKNFLIYNADKLAKIPSETSFKFNAIVFKLYEPLFNEIGPEFRCGLLIEMLTRLSLGLNTELNGADRHHGFIFTDNFELAQISEWVMYFITKSSDPNLFYSHSLKVHSFTELVGVILPHVEDLDSSCQKKVIDGLESATNKAKLSQEHRIIVIDQLKHLRKNLQLKALAVPPLIDDLLSDNSSPIEPEKKPVKKRKTENSHTPHFFFEQHDHWVAKPFGSV